ncbi:MAG: hypothetical protein AAB445_03700 [Patescibacteria group bacterium]
MFVPTLHAKSVRTLFFWVGIIATFAYRIIIFFSDANPALLKISWYVGTIGFIIYFIHRYQISQRRAQVIQDFHLAEKVPTLTELTAEEKAAMAYVLSTLRSTREKWNYIFIFTSSGIALLAGIYLDFLR